jgi:hypothetical protein
MNPLSIASNFSIQKISKHHLLIRGDFSNDSIKSYMEFCDFKWSDTYQGWVVSEDDEVDLIQMHMEVLDFVTDKKKSKHQKKVSPKRTKVSKLSPYEKLKKGYDLSSSDDSDDETWNESESSSSSSEADFDSEKESESLSNEASSQSESEEEEDHSSDETYKPSSSSSDSEEYSEEDEEEYSEKDEEENKRYQFYKNGILGFGKISQKEQDKLKPIWNKYLKGWIFHKSSLEKLKYYGWKPVNDL